LTNVLGLPVCEATAILEREGKAVRLIEVRSKKGGKGDDRRVIRTVETEAETLVYWSAFKTKVTTPQSPGGDSSPCTGEPRD
jgi:hypothetical protein